MSRWVYRLSADERRRLDAFAAAIIAGHKRKGTASKRISTRQSELDIQRLGAYGEYAAAMLLGVPFNWENRKDRGYDLIVAGRTVQVKTYDRLYLPEGNWLAPPYKSGFTAKLAVQVLLPNIGKELGDVATLVAWVERERFEEHKRPIPYGPMAGKLDGVPASFMWPMDLFSLDSDEGQVVEWDPEPPMDEPPPWLIEEAYEDLYTGPRDGGRYRRDSAPQNDTLAELIPPEYVGRTWTYQTSNGPVECRFPPMRDDPQGPVTQEFQDFQMHGGRVTRANHPEYYCVECRARYVSAICPYDGCRSARVGPTGAPRDTQGTPYRCLECRKVFHAALVCGGCRVNMGDEARQLALPLPRVAGDSKRKRANTDPDDVYPD